MDKGSVVSPSIGISFMKKKEILTQDTTWRKLESIMLSEISQSQKGKYYFNTVLCGP
jgi:hypothetical protein